MGVHGVRAEDEGVEASKLRASSPIDHQKNPRFSTPLTLPLPSHTRTTQEQGV